MIEPKLIAVLRCPISGKPLEIAAKPLVERVNAAIASGSLRDRHDQKIDEPIDEGLVTIDGDRLYPVRGEIPTMIADESIDVKQVPGGGASE